MIVLACDPGFEVSALVAWDGTNILQHGILQNDKVLDSFRSRKGRHLGTVLAIEQIESFGMAVGRTVFETVFWTGQFAEAWFPDRVVRVPRKVVKLHLCGQLRAKDGEIRQAILDRFGPTKEQAVGKKAKQGPLFGIASHEWAALAVALTWFDQNPNAPTGATIRPGVIADF